MHRKRVLTLTLVLSLICSIAAIASEKFVLSATTGSDIILQTYELKHNQIKIKHSNVIPLNHGIDNTAITFRNENNTLNFDVYYSVCQDLECGGIKLSMNRIDSNLNSIFQKDFQIPTTHGVHDLVTERLQTQSRN